jgi:hypothetical protein
MGDDDDDEDEMYLEGGSRGPSELRDAIKLILITGILPEFHIG